MISMAIALFLINAPFVAAQALRLVIAGWFAIDAHPLRVSRGAQPRVRRERTTGGAWRHSATSVVVVLHPGRAGWVLTWVVAIAGALRIFGIAWNIIVDAGLTTATEADETVVDELGLADEPEAMAIAADVDAAERARAPIDRAGRWSFIATLFAIHIGRMSTDLTLLGLFSPAVAVLGDMLIAVLITLLVINPIYLLWRESDALDRAPPVALAARDARRSPASGSMARGAWLRWRLTMAIRMRAPAIRFPRRSVSGCRRGLPIAAIVAATVPVWGMSWYFDTENWAAGMWNSWAESRTDTWREAMVRAVLARTAAIAAARELRRPATRVGAGDFSFVVIGDTGEGDASQHVLRDQLLSVANHPDVRFVVVSSDVVYPTGAMNDYEAKFWLPFKGVTRPVYAIPGNHDWYDALEGFAATFLQADAARASIRARVEADLRMTSTTEGAHRRI